MRGSRPTSTAKSHPCLPGAAWNATPGPTRKESSTCRGVKRLSRGVRMARRSSPGRPTRACSSSRSRATRCRRSTRCPARRRQLLKAWVAGGARWGTDPIDPLRTSTDRRAGRDWWSLQPVKRPAPPQSRNGRPRTRSTRSCSSELEAARPRLPPAGRPPHAHPPSRLRPDRSAPDPRGGRGVRGRRSARRVRAPGRSAPRLAPLRRPLGAALARPGPLRREQRVRIRRVPPECLALSRLGRRRPQPRHPLRRVRPASARRRRAPARRPVGHRGDRLPRGRRVRHVGPEPAERGHAPGRPAG